MNARVSVRILRISAYW